MWVEDVPPEPDDLMHGPDGDPISGWRIDDLRRATHELEFSDATVPTV